MEGYLSEAISFGESLIGGHYGKERVVQVIFGGPHLGNIVFVGDKALHLQSIESN